MFLFILICIKKIEAKEIVIIKNIKNNTNIELAQNNNTNTENINNIESIGYYIFSDLKIEWNYNNLEDFLNILNITEDYSIKERVIENTFSGNSFIYIYEIESKQYRLIISCLDNYIRYNLISIELIINENNYLHLFPYKNIEKYMEKTDFGEIVEINSGNDNIFYIMRWGEDDRLGYCDLKFSNGFLESIRIICYTP